MLRLRNLTVASLLFVLFLGFTCAYSQDLRTVPLLDDNPNKVAAPEQKPQDAPATAGAAVSGAAALPGDGWKQTTRISGVKIDFRGVSSLKDVVIKHGPLPVSLNEVTSSEMVEGQQAVLQFRITDAAGAPMSGLKMASWMDLAATGKSADSPTCHKKIQSFLQMQLSARPEVDLNTYYVLALAKEPAILVIDPRIGFSSSKLYAVIDLAAPGVDWVQSRNGERVFVSMPAANQIAAIDTMTFRLIGNIPAKGKPNRVAVQPDGKYLWVAMDTMEGMDTGGVLAIETMTLKVAASVSTGKGRHELAFDENQNLYVTNMDDGTVSIVNTSSLAKVRNVSVGKEPVAVAYSPRSKNMYVAAKGDGQITAISTESQKVSGSIAGQPGLATLIFTPDGRWGFAANALEQDVTLFDVSANKIVQNYKLGHAPDQLALSASYLYVRSRQSAQVKLIPLNEIGSPNVAEFPAGQSEPGALAEMPAAPIVPSLDGDSAFIANPADRRIYYYQEGMAAPMFSMEGYGKTPAAVMVVDRSIHETERGVYSVGLRLPKPGLYDVPLFVESPALSHCFQFTVLENPLLKKKPTVSVNLIVLNNYLQVKTGDASRVRFRLTDSATDKPRNGLADVQVTLLLAEGLRQLRFVAEPVGDGVYQFEFTPQRDGVYYGMVQVPSLRVAANQLPYLMIRASAQETAEIKAPDTAAEKK